MSSTSEEAGERFRQNPTNETAGDYLTFSLGTTPDEFVPARVIAEVMQWLSKGKLLIPPKNTA